MKCETIEEKNGNNNNERSSHWRMRFQQWRWAEGGIERGKKGSEKMNNENNPIHASNNKKSNAWFEFFNEFVHSIQCIQFFLCALSQTQQENFWIFTKSGKHEQMDNNIPRTAHRTPRHGIIYYTSCCFRLFILHSFVSFAIARIFSNGYKSFLY